MSINQIADHIVRANLCHPDQWPRLVSLLNSDLQQFKEAEAFLKSIEEIYLRYTSAKHSAIWGGSFEVEAGGRSEMTAQANLMFAKLLEHMTNRVPVDFSGRRKTK